MDSDKLADIVYKGMKDGEKFHGSIDRAEEWIFNFLPDDREITEQTGIENTTSAVLQTVANMLETWNW